MCEILKDSVGTLIGGVLAASTGYWLFWIERRSNAKDDFLATIDDLRARLVVSSDKLPTFYSESLDVLRRAVYKVRRHLWPSPKSRLQKTFQDYESQKQWFDSPEGIVAFVVQHGEKMPPQIFLRDFLDRFYECITQRAA